MGLRKFKPVTPGTRFRVGASFTEITATTPEKSLVVSSKKSGGRNNTGATWVVVIKNLIV
jgi:large subunit ribosomal protein L2